MMSNRGQAVTTRGAAVATRGGQAVTTRGAAVATRGAGVTTRGVAGVSTVPYGGQSYGGQYSASVPSYGASRGAAAAYGGITSRPAAYGTASYGTATAQAATRTVAAPANRGTATYAPPTQYSAGKSYGASTVVSGTRSALPAASTVVNGRSSYATNSFATQSMPAATSYATQSNFVSSQSFAGPQSFAGATQVYSGARAGAIASIGSIPTSYIGGATIMGTASNLLGAGQIVSERVVSQEECYNSGLVRSEGELVFANEFGQPVIAEPGQPVIWDQGVQMVTEQPPAEVQQQQEEATGPPRVVIICTSSNAMGDQATGAWSEEITGPYYIFLEAGCEVYIASIAGGQVPIDQGSLAEGNYTETDRRFQEENGLQFLENSFALSDISPDAIDCVWLAGGHGACMDFEAGLAQFVTDAVAMGRPVGAVCHGVIGLLSAINQNSTPLLEGKQVTGFSNAEEDIVGLSEKVPFLVQQRMEEAGAIYSCGEPWSEYALADGLIITGQNPQSSIRAAQLCVQAMMAPQQQ